ncbi:MAG TPA: hypothetical protein DCE78_06465 [Bacteroidetes bacterium]|nr:hypothetical protein [Bacteroidota bacterium]
MQLTVDHIEWVTEIEWQNIVDECPWATFYETPEWIKCQDIQNEVQHSGSALLLRFNDSTELLVPLSKKNVLKGFQLQYSGVPGGLYGGPLSKDKLTADNVMIAINFIREKYSNLDYRLNPFLLQELNPKLDFTTLDQSNFTQAINLCQSTEFINREMSAKNVDYDFRNAEKHQIHVEVANYSDLKLFLDTYEGMIVKWGKANIKYTSDFFELLVSQNNCDFWSIYKDNIYIGGGILLKQNTHISSWLTIIQGEYLKFRPYEFVYQFFIHHYKSLGFHWFDFNPSAGLEGVVTFKEKFGTQKLIIPAIQQSGAIVNISNRLREKIRNA